MVVFGRGTKYKKKTKFTLRTRPRGPLFSTGYMSVERPATIVSDVLIIRRSEAVVTSNVIFFAGHTQYAPKPDDDEFIISRRQQVSGRWFFF